MQRRAAGKEARLRQPMKWVQLDNKGNIRDTMSLLCRFILASFDKVIFIIQNELPLYHLMMPTKSNNEKDDDDNRERKYVSQPVACR